MRPRWQLPQRPQQASRVLQEAPTTSVRAPERDVPLLAPASGQRAKRDVGRQGTAKRARIKEPRADVKADKKRNAAGALKNVKQTVRFTVPNSTHVQALRAEVIRDAPANSTAAGPLQQPPLQLQWLRLRPRRSNEGEGAATRSEGARRRCKRTARTVSVCQPSPSNVFRIRRTTGLAPQTPTLPRPQAAAAWTCAIACAAVAALTCSHNPSSGSSAGSLDDERGGGSSDDRRNLGDASLRAPTARLDRPAHDPPSS